MGVYLPLYVELQQQRLLLVNLLYQTIIRCEIGGQPSWSFWCSICARSQAFGRVNKVDSCDLQLAACYGCKGDHISQAKVGQDSPRVVGRRKIPAAPEALGQNPQLAIVTTAPASSSSGYCTNFCEQLHFREVNSNMTAEFELRAFQIQSPICWCWGSPQNDRSVQN